MTDDPEGSGSDGPHDAAEPVDDTQKPDHDAEGPESERVSEADDGANAMDPTEYGDLVDDLVEDARPAADATSANEAAWEVVGDLVPELTDDACNCVLEYADHGPNEAVVAVVTDERGSDDVERRRAEAVSALVRDVEAGLEDGRKDS